MNPLTLCSKCQKNQATVRLTQAQPGAPKSGTTAQGPGPLTQDTLLCEACAKSLGLPHPPPSKASSVAFLVNAARRSRRQALPTCRDCGMDMEEFRRRGRLGCPKCYEVFQQQVGELLEKVHGSRQHVGRVPGVSDHEIERQLALEEKRHELQIAVREEAYASAARLRDEIQALESRGSAPDNR